MQNVDPKLFYKPIISAFKEGEENLRSITTFNNSTIPSKIDSRVCIFTI